MNPNRPLPPLVRLLTQAVAHHQSGRLKEAAQMYDQVLASEPENPDALHLRGLVEHQRGDDAKARPLIEKAVKLKPNEPTFLVNLGEVYRAIWRMDEAEQCQRRAIAIDPRIAEAHANLSVILRMKRQLEEAERSARQAVALNPQLAASHMNLGTVLTDRGEEEAAIRCFQTASRWGERPANVMSNIGDALRKLGRLEEGKQALQEAVRLNPGNAMSHWNLSLIYLLEGDLPRGFAENEWRLRTRYVAAPRLNKPMWDGSDINGKSILIYAEQGFGDAIQFARYATLLADRGATVVLECQPQLVKLLSTVKGIQQVIPRGEQLPDCDLQAPILSLPHLFRTTLATIPSASSYVRIPEESKQKIEPLIDLQSPNLKIAIAWAGNSMHSNDKRRSINPAALAALGKVPGIDWYNLQMNAGDSLQQTGLPLRDLTKSLDDFADSAALLNRMDLLISVDSAAAHLGGAMGLPTWLLLPMVPDWRWLLNSETTPWYPGLRLFRQQDRGNWPEVIERVARTLADHSIPIERNQSGLM